MRGAPGRAFFLNALAPRTQPGITQDRKWRSWRGEEEGVLSHFTDETIKPML